MGSDCQVSRCVLQRIPAGQLVGFLLSVLLLQVQAAVAADDTVSDLVDRNVSAGSRDEVTVVESINHWLHLGYVNRGVDPSERCSDGDFVRRIYLDLAGRIPTENELAVWQQSSYDRNQLIDQILASEDFVQHFADLFDALLMGRASEEKYHERQQSQWRAYLENVIRKRRSWGQVVEEILLARPEEETEKGSVWFLYERNDDYQKMAEAISPSIFGVRIECAQCHDHMMADEIKQSHYWGLVAFFNRSKNSQQGGGPSLSESAIGGFSEFADLDGSSTPNYLTFLDVETVDEDRPENPGEQKESDELYFEHASSLIGRVPKFSRREKFVKEVVRDHPRLARAFVNRVWAILMGRGLVHPFDEMDSMHAPSHPELLDWLSEDLRQHEYDLHRLVRGIVQSDAYQQTSKRRQGIEDPASFAWYLERPLTGEQLARSTLVALQGSDQRDAISLFRQQFPDVLPNDYIATVKDALFLSNSQAYDQLIASSNHDDHLIPRMLKLVDRTQQVESLFRVIYGRRPDQEELKAVAAYLDARAGDASGAMQQVIWSMLSSAEFRLNH